MPSPGFATALGAVIIFAVGIAAGLSMSKARLSMPGFAFYYSPIHNSFLVQGSWKPWAQEITIPLDTSSIECRRATMECIEGSIEIDAKGTIGHVLTTRRKIASWSGEQVVSEFDEWTCFIERDEFDIGQKRVVCRRTQKEGIDSHKCLQISDGRPSIQFLGDGR